LTPGFKIKRKKGDDEMRVKTKAFGDVILADDKILIFENGIIGYPDLRRFALFHDEDSGTDAGIRWLQSLDMPEFAMPVMDPLVVVDDYNPVVEDEWMRNLGNLNSDNILVLVTLRVPSDLTQMTVNLQGPIVINVEMRRGCQVIADMDKYPVKFPIYDILVARKEGR
jgi:flagellar assembly factor FliW